MFQEAFNIKHVDGSYWSLTIELFFYLHALLLIVNKNSIFVNIWSSIYLSLFIINKFFFITIKPFFLNLEYSPLFVAGIYFYKLKFEKTNWHQHIFIIVSLTLYCSFSESHAEQIIVATFFTLFYLFVYNKLNFIIISPILFLGNISYALYLIHQNIGYIIIREVVNLTSNYYIGFVVAIFLCIILAWAITILIEKPIMLYLRQKGYKLKNNTK